MFRRKSQVNLRFVVEVEGSDFHLVGSKITGVAQISNSAPLEIDSVLVCLVGYVCTYNTSKNKVTETRNSFYRAPAVAVLKDHIPGAVLRLSEGVHRLPFELETNAEQCGASCHLRDRMQVLWEVTGLLYLARGGGNALETAIPVRLHTRRELSLVHAPRCDYQSTQRFLTHPAIQYELSVHKSAFISGENVALKVMMDNQSRMELISLSVRLEQRWKCGKLQDKSNKLQFILSDAPLFPLAAKEKREKVIQFRLPDRLEPSVLEVYGAKKQVPVTVEYALCLEFTTSKQDTHQVEIAILLEDNYPPRGALEPPEEVPAKTLEDSDCCHPEGLPAFTAAHAPYAAAYVSGSPHQGGVPHASAHVAATAPPMQQQHPVQEASHSPAAPAYYTMKGAPEGHEVSLASNGSSLYPQVAGMPAFTPPPVPDFVDPAAAPLPAYSSAPYSNSPAETNPFAGVLMHTRLSQQDGDFQCDPSAPPPPYND